MIQLAIEWEDISSRVEQFASEGELLLESCKAVESEEALTEIKKEIKGWEGRYIQFLKDTGIPASFGLINDFHQAGNNSFNMGYAKAFEQTKKEVVTRIGEKNAEVYAQKRLLQACDLITNPDSNIFEQRQTYTTQETLALLLDKLYDLYDNFLYPVVPILAGNGIRLKKFNEEYELLQVLKQHGWVETHPGSGVSAVAQITIEGRLYVEHLRAFSKPDYSHIPSSETALHEVIAEILHKVSMMECGQEVIFNELEELKGLRTTLSPRTWGQLLKAKIVDMVAEQVIDKDLGSLIFEKLTRTKLELPF